VQVRVLYELYGEVQDPRWSDQGRLCAGRMLWSV